MMNHTFFDHTVLIQGFVGHAVSIMPMQSCREYPNAQLLAGCDLGHLWCMVSQALRQKRQKSLQLGVPQNCISHTKSRINFA